MRSPVTAAPTIAACNRELAEPVEAIAPVQPVAILAEPPRAPLILTSNYSLGLDIVADNPVSTRPVRSRAPSASLVDRIYFAVRALKAHGGAQPSVPARRMPRRMRGAWGGQHSLV